MNDFFINLVRILIISAALHLLNNQAACHERTDVDEQVCATTNPSCENMDNNALAIVPYESPILARFHESEKNFRFGEHEVRIKQDWDSTGVAAVVWDAAVVLANYLLEHQEIIRGRRVLELGAGTGLSGIVAAKLGAATTVLTDREMALPVLRENVQLNQLEISTNSFDEKGDLLDKNSAVDSHESIDKDRDNTNDIDNNCDPKKKTVDCDNEEFCDMGRKFDENTSTHTEISKDVEENSNEPIGNSHKMDETLEPNKETISPHVQVVSLDWGQELNPDHSEFDVIIGADIIYIEDTFPLLLKTLLDLTETRKEDIIVLLSCKIRYERDERFLNMLRTHFSVIELVYDKKTDIHIYQATRILKM